MKVEKLINQRFTQLAEKAKSVLSQGNVDTEAFHGWSTGVLNLLQRAFGENSAHYQNFTEKYKAFSGYPHQFDACRGIFYAAKEDYEGGFLFSLRALIKAEVLSGDVLEQASELLRAGYKDPACVLAGVALESALKEMCTRESISQGKLDRMNADLCKQGLYNLARQKQITAWADLRNKAAHGDWGEYDRADVEAFVEGVERFIADYL